MSTSSIEMEPEQNDGPTNGSPRERNVSDNHVRPNTDKDGNFNYPWTDYLLNEESDEKSLIKIQQNGRNIQYNDATMCENDNSSVNSETDGVGINDPCNYTVCSLPSIIIRGPAVTQNKSQLVHVMNEVWYSDAFAPKFVLRKVFSIARSQLLVGE